MGFARLVDICSSLPCLLCATRNYYLTFREDKSAYTRAAMWTEAAMGYKAHDRLMLTSLVDKQTNRSFPEQDTL